MIDQQTLRALQAKVIAQFGEDLMMKVPIFIQPRFKAGVEIASGSRLVPCKMCESKVAIIPPVLPLLDNPNMHPLVICGYCFDTPRAYRVIEEHVAPLAPKAN